MKVFLLASLFLSQLSFATELTVKTVELPAADRTIALQGPIESIGGVISIGKDLVALGQSVYDLVQKGKPNITTDYAAINVVPRDPVTKSYVNPDELEGTSEPLTKRYRSVVKLGSIELASLEYMLIFSYGGSYQGKGKYIQNAIIVPVDVQATYGWDMTAQMKLLGTANRGTAAAPVANAILVLKYSMRAVGKMYETSQVISVNGDGTYTVK